MKLHLRSLTRHPGIPLLFAALWGLQANMASAQNLIVAATTAELGPPVSPAKSPGPMSLEACIELGMKHQPSLDAARASLAAAQDGQAGLDRFPLIARPFTPDLKIRKQQSCVGITINQAALTQAEWETRYAITRNFFTVQYIRSQKKVVEKVIQDLDSGYSRAEKIFKEGNPDFKITLIDLDAIKIQKAIVRSRKAQVDNGMLRALAALREAIGLKHDYPLDIAAVDLPPAVYKINMEELISAALANRGELIQANSASRVVSLEVEAQKRIFGPQGRTFGMGSDIHVQPIPQGIMNGEYRPGAIGLEMPPSFAGPRRFRVARAGDLFQRSLAVVDKATSLVSLDVEAQYLKWQEAVEGIQSLSSILEKARELPGRLGTLKDKDFTSTAVIQANTTAISVQVDLNDAIHMHALALAGLERATAGAFRIYPVPGAAAKAK